MPKQRNLGLKRFFSWLSFAHLLQECLSSDLACVVARRMSGQIANIRGWNGWKLMTQISAPANLQLSCMPKRKQKQKKNAYYGTRVSELHGNYACFKLRTQQTSGASNNSMKQPIFTQAGPQSPTPIICTQMQETNKRALTKHWLQALTCKLPNHSSALFQKISRRFVYLYIVYLSFSFLNLCTRSPHSSLTCHPPRLHIQGRLQK